MRREIVFLVAAVGVLVGTAYGQTLLLKNAQIVDPKTQRIHFGSMIIRDERIEAVSDQPPVGFSGEVLDAQGKWVIPGLNDMHVHSYGNMAPGNRIQFLMTAGTAKVVVQCGVTAFLDLFSMEDHILPLRDQQRKEGLPGADIYAAGPIFTCTGGHGTEYGIATRVINSPEEARRQITDLARRKPDVIKIVYDHQSRMPTIDRETMAAAVQTASEHGIRTVIHIGTWQDAREAIEAGASAITHLGRGEIPDDLIDLIRQRDVFVIPTMTVQTELAHFVRHPELLDSPLLKTAATTELLQAYRDTASFDERTKRSLRWQVNNEEQTYRNVKRLADAGVRIMTGTDAGNLGTFQGYSVHREMQILVEAGLSPWQALAAATLVPGDFLQRRFGVTVGDDANLVLLDGSPIEEIRNTERIAVVIHHGKVVGRPEQETTEHAGASSGDSRSVPWTKALLDDFSGPDLTSSIGVEWDINLDKDWGGRSRLNWEKAGGVLRVTGELAPPANGPAVAELALLLDHGRPVDVKGFDGIRLRIKSLEGPLFLKILTSSVTNFDYHAVLVAPSSEFQDLELPFSRFHQVWSAPVRWSGDDVQGLSLQVSSFQATPFAFEVDRIEFFGSSEE